VAPPLPSSTNPRARLISSNAATNRTEPPLTTTALHDQLQRTLGDAYVVERELAGGGMSRVFVATETALRREVVIKVLPHEMTGQLSLDRFRREIGLAARLQHAHIVPLLSAGESEGLPFFTMPYVVGESLRARIAKGGELPLHEAMRVLREIASALSYAHAQGIVHRDIKPENVLLSGGAAMVTDFGVAKALSESTSAGGEGLTSIGVALGTPAYMAPEQASADPLVDQRADLYAWGVMAYELLTGQAPFAGRSPQAMLAAHVSEAPELITRRRTSVPPALAQLVMQCLEKRPADRPQSADDLLRMLDSITTPSGGSTPADRPRSAVASPARAPRLALALGTMGVVFAALFWWRGRAPMSANGGVAVAADTASVAVLPFTELSQDKSTGYFGDGIAETLISALANVPGLNVTARTSAFSFRGKNTDVREIGRQLGVATVLEGTVQRAGDKLRITAQLVNTGTGVNIWSQTFDRSAADIFAVQDEVARAVVTALKGRLLVAQAPARATAQTRDPVTYDLYLQGRFYFRKRGQENLEKAIDFFKQAIARDSLYAAAWSGLGDAYSVLPNYAPTADAAKTEREARVAAARAVGLDPTLGEAQATLGEVLSEDWQWAGADSALRRAIALSPGYSTAYSWYGELLIAVGRFDEGLVMAQRGVDLDRLSPIALNTVGRALQANGQIDEAYRWFEKALALDPDFAPSNQNAMMIDLDRADSVGFFNHFPDKSMKDGFRQVWQAGGRDAVRRAFIDQRTVPPTMRAYQRAALGDLDGAFRELDTAIATRDGLISFWYPIFVGPILKDPRFAAVAKRAGLPALSR